MTQRKTKLSIRDMVEAIERTGARFQFSTGGCLYLRGLASLPGDLARLFLESDPRALVATVRERMKAHV